MGRSCQPPHQKNGKNRLPLSRNSSCRRTVPPNSVFGSAPFATVKAVLVVSSTRRNDHHFLSVAAPVPGPFAVSAEIGHGSNLRPTRGTL
jgi:hypothetical protein